MTQVTAPALSRTPRQGLRRARGWLVLLAILLVGSGIAVAIQLSLATTSNDPMGASNPGQQGGQALARVLSQHGVEVRTAGTLAQARQEASGRSTTTVLLSDPNGILDAAQLRSVRALGSALVTVDPRFTQLEAIAPGVGLAGRPAAARSSQPACSVPAARLAGTVAGVTNAFRATGDADGCFAVGDAYALAQVRGHGATVTVVGSQLLDNGGIDKAGNAALAIGLLGEHSTLVWYLPSDADAAASGPGSLADITPGWLTPAILLLIAVVVAAAVWSGRRFGPLVVESLPVVVRSTETLEGRARLYRTASARVHALDALRVGALRRMAALCGLPPHASVDQAAAAVTGLTGWQAADAHAVLIDDEPQTDAAVLACADRLAELERDVRAAVRGGAQ